MNRRIFLIVSTSLFISYQIWRRYKRRKLPRGPRGLPFIGNFFQLDSERPHQTLEKWGKQYKDIFKITLLGQDKVVLSGDYVRHALVTDSESFAGRARFVRLTDIYHKNSFTISFTGPSPRWRKVKKAVMTSMKSYGVGLNRIESLVHGSAEELLSVIDSYKSLPFNPQDIILQTMAKVIFNIVYEENLSPEDAKKLLALEKRAGELTSVGGYGTELELLPFLKHIRFTYVNEMEKMLEGQKSIHQPAVETCKVNITRNCIASAVHRYNDTVERPEDKLTEIDKFYTIADLAFAGMSTSSASLYSLLALCLTHPEVTSKIHTEIDDIIGLRVPKIDDRGLMPYVNAVIMELFRIISHVPLLLPHATTCEVEIGGYTLPKGQEVWLNVWSLHHDPRFWHDPEVFKPERFLTDDGQLVPASHPRRQRLFPFGGGRRACPGENLARSRIFLLICMIFQRYDILPESEHKLPISDPRQYKVALVMRPDDYKMRFIPRKCV